MTEDGNDVPDVPTYDPATVAWNLSRKTVGGQPGAPYALVREAFMAGYRAGHADGEAGRG